MRRCSKISERLMPVAVWLVLLLGFAPVRAMPLAGMPHHLHPGDSSPERRVEIVATCMTLGDPLIPSRTEPLPEAEAPARRSALPVDAPAETPRPISHTTDADAVHLTCPPRYCSLCSFRI